jgi:molybdopterin molybdotransferase
MADEIPWSVAPGHDPRMRGFRTRTSLAEADALIDQRVGPLPAETIDFREAAERVLAGPIQAAQAVPAFDRAAMDGYAVRGEETFGATSYSPALFRRVGAVRPGRRCAIEVGPGEAVEITTGSALPAGADTVVKVESTQSEGDSLLVFEATPPGRHVGRRGEDIAAGTVVLPAGRVLRPQDLGVLSAVAARSVSVIRRPSVAVLITGDELLEPGTPAEGVQIADANSVMLAALIARDGGRPRIIGPLPDDRARIRDEIARAMREADALLISGGSSAGPEDHAPGLVAELGELAVHGVALRPASPAGIGFLGSVPVVLLPGNPVSCLCAYDFFAGPIVRRLGGRPRAWPYRPLALPLARKLVSIVGRVDYARVRIVNGQVEPLAISGASILSSTTRADGFVVIPADREGYPAGATVTVWLYDEYGNHPQMTQIDTDKEIE